MQKLTRISSGKNNESCRIIHHESNRIGFAFFLFFYNFLQILQETGKSLYYWSYHFAERPLERFVALQCGPWGRPAGAGEANSGEARRSLAGQGLGKGARVTRVRFGGADGGEKPPVGGAPATGGGGRRGPCCGAAEPRRGWPGRGKGGEEEGHAHDDTTDPLLNSRRAPYRSGRTAGLPSVPTGVRRRRVEHAAARPPRRLGRGNLGACGLVSRASLGQGARPRSAGRHRTPRQHGAARRGRRGRFSLGHFEHDFLPKIE
jgi:hypothetical protein